VGPPGPPGQDGDDGPCCHALQGDGSATISCDDGSMASVYDGGSGSGGGGGGVFTRWGNGNQPPNTTLIYSGVLYSSHYTHNGSGTSLCMAPHHDDPGEHTGGSSLADYTYPALTHALTPPGITGYSRIKCAVILSDSPTVNVVGTWNSPPGWSIAYKGILMGAHYSEPAPNERSCVDSDEFDDSLGHSRPDGGLYRGTTIAGANGMLDKFVPTRFVKCATLIKQ